mmetsp:Transcript_1164/g.1636  ORF Transcript_1164/g.1636 Transcript_1164/m.1636 type:complete len:174 (-) Transcript_1164:847-1368(-)
MECRFVDCYTKRGNRSTAQKKKMENLTCGLIIINIPKCCLMLSHRRICNLKASYVSCRGKNKKTIQEDVRKQVDTVVKKCNFKRWDGCAIQVMSNLKTRKCLEQMVQNKAIRFHLDSLSRWMVGILSGSFSDAFERLVINTRNGKHFILVEKQVEESLIVLRYAYGLSLDDLF